MNTGGVALALSAVALGTAVVALTRERPVPQRAPVRDTGVRAIEMDVAELRREFALLKARRSGPPDHPDRRSIPGVAEDPGAIGGTADAPGRESELESIVDDAVERKTKRVLDELRVKEDKKPPMELFAAVLELSEQQRAVTERLLVEGQREVHRIIATPTYDGTNLMDELVEIAAKGIAEPGKDHGFGRWIGRLLVEKIPGTDETYGTRLEAVKQALRDKLEREWSAEQYREFEEWGVDPTEIQEVPGSPNEPLEKRILERAQTLGADIPKDE